jgi:hypothetical protein
MGFKTLMLQVEGMKDLNSAIIIVSLLPLIIPCQSGHKACEPEINAFSDIQHDDGTIYSKKVSLLIYNCLELADRFEHQINLDDQLAPIMSMLEETNPISSCLAHSSICCYVQQP